MALSTVFQDFEADLLNLNDDISILYGEEHLDFQGSPPQLVIVPTTDTYDGAFTNRSNPDGGPKVLRTVLTGIDFHCWGVPGSAQNGSDAFDGALELRQQVISILQDQLGGGGYKVRGGQWMTKQGEGDELTQLGRWYVLHVVIEQPIVNAIEVTTAEIKSLPITTDVLTV